MGACGVVRPQAGQNGGREALLGGVDDENAALAQEGAGVAERGKERDSFGHQLRFAEVEERGLLRREVSGGSEVEWLALGRVGSHGRPPFARMRTV